MNRHPLSAFKSCWLGPAAFLSAATAILITTGEAVGGGVENFDVNTLVIPGAVAGDNFGKSVAGIGDFSNNGFEDLAVGAPFADLAADSGGAVFLYFGDAESFGPPADRVLMGNTAHDHFGISVTGGGDFDGDGCPDIAVGARFDDAGATDGGAVYVYPGCVPPETLPLLLAGEAADDWFGQSVAMAGDVNGDGHNDLIVGAPYNDEAANASGKAYVFFGGPAADTTVDVELFGDAQSNAHFGWSVAGVGDVNSDGFDDVVVGARLHGTGGQQARGRAYLFLGSEAMDATVDQVFDGENAHDWFGEAVGNAGDINNDGHSDVAVGAIYNDSGDSAAGKAYVFLGGDPVDSVADFSLAGPEQDAQLGNALAGGRDITGDGISDLSIGAHFADAAEALNAGRVSLWLGSVTSPRGAVVQVYGSAADDQLGEAVGLAGPIPGSGTYASFVAGAHFADPSGDGSGETVVGYLTEAVIFTNGFEAGGLD